MTIKAVFIDIDDTLLDFAEYVKHTMKTGFEDFGLIPYEPYMFEVFTQENGKLWRRIEDATLTFARLQEIRWNTIFEKLGITADGPAFEKYFRAALHESAIPVDGAMETLKKLKEKYILCAASNGPYNQQMHRLELAGMVDLFDYIFISEDIGCSKPAKEFFDIAFSRINESRPDAISPEECLIIGDSMTSDMAGGINCGMKTCFFTKNKEKHFDADKVDTYADRLIDIPDLIETLC